MRCMMRYSTDQMKELSFIIPVYNIEKYIARCLDSIYSLPLNEEQFEVLCIDDCSQDGSASLIEVYQELHSNLRLIKHEKNGRQGAARNTGIRQAKGEYCMFVDADDSLPCVDLLEHIEYMRQNDLELLLGKANVIGGGGQISKWGLAPDEESAIMSGPDIFVGEYIHKVGFGVVWLGIYKTDLVKRVPPFLENTQYEDTDWTLRCAYESKQLQYKPVVLYNYHINPSSTTTTKSIKSLVERTKQALRIYQWALSTKERHDEVVFAAEDYGTWNLRGLAGLVKYGYQERRSFYRSFSRRELRTISGWWGGNYTKIYVRFPILSQILLCVGHPCYLVYKFFRAKK